MMKLRILVFLLVTSGLYNSVNAQQGFGTSNPNKDAVIELNSANKGLLVPRIALSALNVASPLQAHVAGMVVYNTATSEPGQYQVIPGYYFNNGTLWVKVLLSTDKAWYNVATNKPADNNLQNIYQMGKVGIGTISPSSALHVTGDGTNDPLVLQSLIPISSTDGNKMMMINNSTGIVTYTDIPPPDSYVLQASGSVQTFGAGAFTSSSSAASATVISFSQATDELLPANFATLASDMVTIGVTGDYDMTASCNLLMPSSNSNYSGSANSFMNISLEIQLSATSTGGPWTTIASTTNTINYSSFGKISTLKPVVALQRLTKGNLIRVIIYRGAGISRSGGSTLPGTGALGNGIVQNRFLKITRYN